MNKCVPITKRTSDNLFSKEYLDECEERIKDFDSLMEIKIDEKDISNEPLNNVKEKEENTNIKKMVNTHDKDGNYHIHYLAKK